jgi:hypothetical protein
MNPFAVHVRPAQSPAVGSGSGSGSARGRSSSLAAAFMENDSLVDDALFG